MYKQNMYKIYLIIKPYMDLGYIYVDSNGFYVQLLCHIKLKYHPVFYNI